MYVTEIYEFTMIANAAASAESLAEEGVKRAKEFFGDNNPTIVIEITGQKGQWIVNARAEANVRVEDEWDGY